MKNMYLNLNKNKEKIIECFECNAVNVESFQFAFEKILFSITGKRIFVAEQKMKNILNFQKLLFGLNKEKKKLIDCKIKFQF
jgi:hypothetical protein